MLAVSISGTAPAAAKKAPTDFPLGSTQVVAPSASTVAKCTASLQRQVDAIAKRHHDQTDAHSATTEQDIAQSCNVSITASASIPAPVTTDPAPVPGRSVAHPDGGFPSEVQIEAEACAAACWVWYQWLGPTNYFIYGSTVWHGLGWGGDYLDNCAHDGGFGWTVTVNVCEWQGNNPANNAIGQTVQAFVGFHTSFLFSWLSVSYYHWIRITCGDLGWTVTGA